METIAYMYAIRHVVYVAIPITSSACGYTPWTSWQQQEFAVDKTTFKKFPSRKTNNNNDSRDNLSLTCRKNYLTKCRLSAQCSASRLNVASKSREMRRQSTANIVSCDVSIWIPCFRRFDKANCCHYRNRDLVIQCSRSYRCCAFIQLSNRTQFSC